MISQDDLRLARLAVARGFLAPECLGDATALAATSGQGLVAVLTEQGWLDPEALATLLRDVKAPAPSKAEKGSDHPSRTATLQPSVAYLLSQSLGFAPELQLGSGGSAAPAPAPAQGREESWPAPQSGRSEIWGEIATGGMGRIYLAYDRDINRKVAMKVMRNGGQYHPARVKRFIEEIQATGQLEHPSIVPIYDMGLMQDGQPFFIMRYVKGRSLEAILEEIGRSNSAAPLSARQGARSEMDRERAGEYGRVRLLSIFHQVCMAVHFAHEKGVIHRDLKPANVMIGSYGEVQIMDWGLAKVRGRTETVDFATAVDLISPEDHPATLDGQVIGTPAYMPPEQAAGHASAADERSDVYSLGAILYTMLTMHSPVSGANTKEILERVQAGDLVPPRTRAPDRQVPEILEDICLRAMALRSEDRHVSAKLLADDVTAYLEGHRERERNHALAEHHYAEGMRLAVRYSTLKLELQDQEEKAAQTHRASKPWWPFEQRRHVWAARSDAEHTRLELAESFAAATDQFYRALRYEQEHSNSRAALADLYWDRFRVAENRQNSGDQIMYRNLVERHDDGRYAALLQGDGKCDVVTQPIQAECFLNAINEERPAFTLQDERYLGTAPLRAQVLPMGSYMLRLVAPGHRDTNVSFRIPRAGHVKLQVKLYDDKAIGDNFVYVPGGSVPLGGDPQASSPRERFECDCPDFFIGRYPVTVAEYRIFLEDLLATSGEDACRPHLPRESSEGAPFWVFGSKGKLKIRPDCKIHFQPRYPISCVSWEDAMAYCSWLSQRLGQVVSLPHDTEWEKAARGADARAFPWGNEHDYTFANNAHSHESGGRLVPVGTFPMDRSPYGVMDMTGNVSELCRNSPAPSYAHAAVIKGGGYSVPGLDSRAAGRAMLAKTMVRKVVGFRVAVYPEGLASEETP